MISYEDFLLNELVGLTGLDDEEISEILKKIEEERAAHERDDSENLSSNNVALGRSSKV